jgi:hypothetical protein
MRVGKQSDLITFNTKLREHQSSIGFTAGAGQGIENTFFGIAQRKLERDSGKCHWFADQKNPARSPHAGKSRSQQRPSAVLEPHLLCNVESWQA